MKKILVAVDFSEASLNALKYAIKLAKFTKAELSILTVYNTIHFTPIAVLGDMNKHLIDDSIELKNKLEKLLTKINANDKVKYKIYAVVGVPEIEIQKYSRKLNCTLIVMGQTGNGNFKRFLLGSTTSHVVNTSQIPVMIIPSKFKFKPYKQIVFTSDLNPKNFSFMKSTVDFARVFNSSIKVLFIDTEGGYDAETKILQMQAALTKKFNYPKISGVILTDLNVKDGINNFVASHKADLAVLVKYHPTLAKLISTKPNSGKLADSISIPVLVLES